MAVKKNLNARDAPLDVALRITETESSDAAGRLRVGLSRTLFDSKLVSEDSQPMFWDEVLETGAGITASTPTVLDHFVDLISTINTAGAFTRQTFRRFGNQLGKGLFVQMSATFGDLAAAGAIKRVGQFDDLNGLYFESREGIMHIVGRTNESGSPSETERSQDRWNIDTLDGSGDTNNPSQLVIDFTKIQTFVIDYQSVAAGRLRFGFIVQNRILYIHEVQHFNAATRPLVNAAALPLRFQMTTEDFTPETTLRAYNATVVSDGGLDEVGIIHTEATTQSIKANSINTFYALLGFRLKTTALDCRVSPLTISVLDEDNSNFEWVLFFNPTVAGTFTFGDKDDSCLQVAIGDNVGNPSTNTVTGGMITDRGFVQAKDTVTLPVGEDLKLGVAIDGTRDIFVLAMRPLAPNGLAHGSVTWREML